MISPSARHLSFVSASCALPQCWSYLLVLRSNSAERLLSDALSNDRRMAVAIVLPALLGLLSVRVAGSCTAAGNRVLQHSCVSCLARCDTKGLCQPGCIHTSGPSHQAIRQRVAFLFALGVDSAGALILRV